MHDLIYDIETASKPEDYLENKKAGLDPINTGFIISIGCTVDGKLEIFYGDDEKKALQEFWDYLDSTQVRRFVGFNNSQFDDHFLFWRTCANNIDAGFNFLDYNGSFDLRPFLLKLQKRLYGQDKFTKGKLTEVAAKLGVSLEDVCVDLDGSHMQEMYEKKDWASIYKHQEDDIKLTWRLYQRVRRFMPPVKKRDY